MYSIVAIIGTFWYTGMFTDETSACDAYDGTEMYESERDRLGSKPKLVLTKRSKFLPGDWYSV
jgi:hypothetical protein